MMDLKIMPKDAFQVAGISMAGKKGAPFHELWERLFSEWDGEALSELGSGQSFGCCYDMKEDGQFRYMAGFDVTDVAMARKLGLDILEVPAARYAVLKLVGPMPECIHEGWQYLMDSFFPEQGYTHAGSPDFEVYGQGDMRAPEYEMELWVPIVQTKQRFPE